jgi:hypothetical protein
LAKFTAVTDFGMLEKKFEDKLSCFKEAGNCGIDSACRVAVVFEGPILPILFPATAFSPIQDQTLDAEFPQVRAH